MRVLTGAIALILASAVQAAPLTIHVGESWLFDVRGGQPAHAHKVQPAAKPGKGKMMVTVRSLFGTTMVLTNNSKTSYTLSAELIHDGKASAARTCILPGGGRPVLEQWEAKAEAVRIGNFHATGNGGHC